MTLPNLIHPVPVKIQRMNRSVTVIDPVAREPVRQMWKAGQGPGTGSEILLEAQVNWNAGKIGEPSYKPGAPEETFIGYLLFRVFDLIAAGVATDNGDGTVTVEIERGDRIVQIGIRRTNLYVVWFRDVAGYPDQGGTTLLEVNFTDRKLSSPAEE